MTMTAARSVESLRAALRGTVLDSASPDYDGARQLHNAMIDKRPALIVRCRDAADVRAALAFGSSEGLEVAVRGGAHHGAGLGSVDGGVVIDLSLMNGVRVDPGTRTATVDGGALLGDVDHATGGFGLAVPAGILSTTGVGGLTLGGGHGYLTRKHGLTVDNLRSADVVLADGSFLTASEDEHEDRSGRCAGVAATSVSSPPSGSSSTRSRRSSAARRSGPWRPPPTSCAGTASSYPLRPTMSTASSRS